MKIRRTIIFVGQNFRYLRREVFIKLFSAKFLLNKVTYFDIVDPDLLRQWGECQLPGFYSDVTITQFIFG